MTKASCVNSGLTPLLNTHIDILVKQYNQILRIFNAFIGPQGRLPEAVWPSG